MDCSLAKLVKAKNYAFRLLKFRLRSEAELEQRLKRKKFTQEVIRQTINFLKEKKFIDDREFARCWIESRLRQTAGFRRIRQELRLKGIDPGVMQEEIDSARQGYCEGEITLRIAKEKISQLKGLEPAKLKRRIYAYLLRRGFSPETVIETINAL